MLAVEATLQILNKLLRILNPGLSSSNLDQLIAAYVALERPDVTLTTWVSLTLILLVVCLIRSRLLFGGVSRSSGSLVMWCKA